MLFDSFLSLVWDGSILCRFVEAYSVTQQDFGSMQKSLSLPRTAGGRSFAMTTSMFIPSFADHFIDVVDYSAKQIDF